MNAVVLVAGFMVHEGSKAEAPSLDAARWSLPLSERQLDPFPRSYTNGSGEAVEIPQPPTRVVSGTLFSDAVLLAICPPERIVALQDISRDPQFSPVAQQSQNFPRHIQGDPESLILQVPDLIFLAGFSRKETAEILYREGRTVARLQGFESLDGIVTNLRATGYLLGLDAEAEQLVQEMQQRLQRVAQGKKDRQAWRLLLWADGYTAGSNTTFDGLLTYVGAGNLAAEQGMQGSIPLNAEVALLMRPDALVVGALPGEEEATRLRLLQSPALRNLAAVRNDRIIFVPKANLLSTSHHVAAAAEVMASTLDRWGLP